MKKQLTWGATVAAGLLALSCGSGDTSSETVGAVSLPLSATDNGVLYTLSPARLRATGVTNPEFVQTYNASEQDVFRADLAPGQYQLELLSGWTLNEDDAPVADRVVLESPNPVPFDVEAGVVTPVRFVLGIGDRAISFGNGQVAADIDVNDHRGGGGTLGAGGAGGSPECTFDIDCDDGDSCTTDSCDAATASCATTNVAHGSSCDFAGTSGSCLFGVCFVCTSNGSCSDANSCTNDVCSDGQCTYESRPSGAACTADGGATGTCFLGRCQPDTSTGGTICENPPCL